jgi:hypothetical protein
MDSIIFSAANLEARVRETILQALPPEKTIFKEIVVLYSDPSKTKSTSMYLKYTSWAEILHNNPPDQSEGWDKIITVGDNPFYDHPPSVLKVTKAIAKDNV